MMRMITTLTTLMALSLAGPIAGLSQPSPNLEMQELKQQVARQQSEIEELKAAVAEQRALLARWMGTVRASSVEAKAESPAAAAASPLLAAQTAPPNTAAARDQVVQVQQLAREAERVSRNLGGFQFSGDFRYRLDLQLRSANEVAPALQNTRGRYRVRLNIDKGLDRLVDPKLKFHLQLSTGPYNVQTTNDQDFGGMAAKQPFSVAEAYINYAPSSKFSIRGGRGEEVFADSMRFLWDDDIRFNGFQQILTLPVAHGPLGIKSVEFRAGEYILSHPHIVALTAGSPYLAAGYQLGQKVRDAALFHPGAIVRGDIGPLWSHYLQADMSLYRNPNQIVLASTAAGYPVVVGNPIGVQIPAPVGQLGTATTLPGGAIYTASRFQIAHLAYRLERKAVRLGAREMPLWFDFQASRNVGTSRLRDAVMASANLGAIRKFGDLRFLYQFAIKDANSLISQFTDDDLGTGVGANIAVHALRFDIGITRYLQWQNLVFIQTERRSSNPAEQLFIPLQRGANPTLRYLGQLAFTF